ETQTVFEEFLFFSWLEHLGHEAASLKRLPEAATRVREVMPRLTGADAWIDTDEEDAQIARDHVGNGQHEAISRPEAYRARLRRAWSALTSQSQGRPGPRACRRIRRRRP